MPASGAALCWLNGVMTTTFRVKSFIVTLAVMWMASGQADIVSDGQSIDQVPESFIWLGRGADLFGIPNAVVETSQMILAPAGTPAPIVARLAEATRAILAKPDIKEKMLTAGFLVKYEGPEDLRARMAREIPMWKEVVERAGLAK